jgi:hypothetical protein
VPLVFLDPPAAVDQKTKSWQHFLPFSSANGAYIGFTSVKKKRVLHTLEYFLVASFFA